MNMDLQAVVLAVGSVGARISGLLLFAPFFGSNAVAPRIKVGLVLVLTALLYPVCGVGHMQLSAWGLFRLVVGELLVGLLIGLSAQLVFQAVQFAGHVMGVQVGYSLVNIMDPNSQVDTPVLSLFSETLVMLLFLGFGFHRSLLRGLAKSFHYIAPGGMSVSGEMVHDLLHAAGGIWLAGVQVAAPLLLTTILADVMLGFLGKASPQLPVLFLGISAKSMAGLLALAAALKYWPGMFEQYFQQAVNGMERLLRFTY